MEENCRPLFKQILGKELTNLCFWENFNDKDNRRIYGVTGELSIDRDRKGKVKILYLDKTEVAYKTMEEMLYDYAATPTDLIDFGKTSVLQR